MTCHLALQITGAVENADDWNVPGPYNKNVFCSQEYAIMCS
jgi:hypothetical protein